MVERIELTKSESFVVAVLLPVWGCVALVESFGYFDTTTYVVVSKYLFIFLLLGQLRRILCKERVSDGDDGRY